MPWTAKIRNEDILEEAGGRQYYYGTQLLHGSSDISAISREKKMKTWRNASGQGWQKVHVEEEDRGEPGAMTSKNGHICQHKRRCS